MIPLPPYKGLIANPSTGNSTNYLNPVPNLLRRDAGLPRIEILAIKGTIVVNQFSVYVLIILMTNSLILLQDIFVK